MKNIFIILALAVFLVGCSSEVVIDSKKLQKRNEVYYEVNNEKPFTGKSVDWYENGQKKAEGNHKDGKQEGLWTFWYENGHKAETNYKNGEKDGLSTEWYENGKKKFEKNWKSGVMIQETKWDKNGNLIK